MAAPGPSVRFALTEPEAPLKSPQQAARQTLNQAVEGTLAIAEAAIAGAWNTVRAHRTRIGGDARPGATAGTWPSFPETVVSFTAYLRFELRRPGHCIVRGYPGVTLIHRHQRLSIQVRREPAARAAQRQSFRPSRLLNLVYRPCTEAQSDHELLPPQW